jgi:hypothetical protein
MPALLRYRRIAYRFLQGAEDVDGLPRPKVGHSERLLLAGPMDRSGSVPACGAGATKAPFADRSNIVYRLLSANIGNRGSC